MYLTSCFPSSFPFNKTYAVAVTREATKSRRWGVVPPAALPRGTVAAPLSRRGEREAASPASFKEGLWAVDHQETAVTGQPHHLLQQGSPSPREKVIANHRFCERTTTLFIGLHLVGDICPPHTSLVAWVVPCHHGGGGYQA